MTLNRRIKWISTAALSLGMFAILAVDGVEAASKAAEAKKAIADLAAAKEPSAKAAALEQIGKIAQVQKSLATPAMSDIRKAMTDASPVVRKAAATAYGRCDPDPKEGVPLLVKMLKDEKNEEVKIGIAQGLAAMGPGAKDAMPAIREQMKIERAKAKDGKQTKLQRELGNTGRAIAERKKN